MVTMVVIVVMIIIKVLVIIIVIECYGFSYVLLTQAFLKLAFYNHK